jgi:hypothetical protein
VIKIGWFSINLVSQVYWCIPHRQLFSYFDGIRLFLPKIIYFAAQFEITGKMKKDSSAILTKDSKWTGVKRKFKKVLFAIGALVVIVFSIIIYWKYYYTYSSGYRFGLLQKFSHKGNIFKTYEGEMILNSISSNSNVVLSSEKFLFSVTDKKLAQQLDTIQGRMVTVHYKQKNGVLSWKGESEYLVDSVKYKIK